MLNTEEIKFINDNIKENTSSLLLKYHGKEDLNYKFLVQQIAARNRVKKKLPTMCENPQVVFPPSLNLEQSSSEATSQYKRDFVATLIEKDGVGADLTSGLGIDAIFMSENFKEYHHLEPNRELLDISEANYKALEISNVTTHNTTCEAFLENNTINDFEFLYLDPCRRDEKSGEKVVLLEDYSPNIIELEDELLNISKRVLVKTSPILDYNDSIRKLKHVVEVHVVSYKNEVKEVLYLLEKKEVEVIAFKAVNFTSDNRVDILDFTYDDIKNSEVTYGRPQRYIYEPNSSIMKALAFNFISQKYKLDKLHPNSHLYTSNEVILEFPGRVFKLQEAVAFNKQNLKGIKKAHVACRNFPSTVMKIRKKCGIKDGGNTYLFGTTLGDESNVILICKKEV